METNADEQAGGWFGDGKLTRWLAEALVAIMRDELTTTPERLIAARLLWEMICSSSV